MIEMLSFVSDKWTFVPFCSNRPSNHKVVIVVSSHNRLLIDKHVSAPLERVAVRRLFADKNAGGSRFIRCSVRVITERRRHEQRKQTQNREVGQLLHGAAAAATLQV